MNHNLKKVLFPFFTLCLFSLQAQLSQGFDQLKDKNYEAALTAFQEAVGDKSDQIPAQWGIAQVLSAPDYEKHNFDSAFALKTIIETGLRKNKDSKLKKKWGKKYDLTPEGLKNMAKPLAENRWKELDGSKNLAGFDTYLRVFKNRIPAKIKSKVELQWQKALRADATGGATTYDKVNYLLSKHNAYLKDSFPGRYEPLQDELFSYFLKEKEGNLATVRAFMSQHPKHKVSTHSSRNDFDQAYADNTNAGWIRFLNSHSNTPFDELIYQHLTTQLSQQPLTESQKAELSQEERWTLEDIEQGVQSGQHITPNSNYQGKGLDQWLSYIKRRVGKPAGFVAFKSVLKYSIEQRDWTTATSVLNNYGDYFPSDSTMIRNLKYLVSGPDNGIRPVKLLSNISTSTGDEYSPTISFDGKTLAFCGATRKESIWGEDIYFSEQKDSVWQEAKLSKDLSGSGHEAPMCFTADGNTLVMFKNGKVFTSNRNTTGWSPAAPFQVDLSQFGWVSDVHFVPGEQRVFFAARTEGWDTDGTDIFMAAKNEDGVWGKPEKLVASINTEGFSDRSPFVHPDQTTMYFSSAREGGLGGLDVYKTVRLDDTWQRWSDPVNLGKNINTTNNNWGYVVTTDGASAYYSARLDDGKNEDIYFISLPKEARPDKVVKPVEIIVQDDQKKPIPNALVAVRNSNTGNTAGEYRTSPKTGKVTVYIPQGERVTVSAIQVGYYGEPISIDSRNEGSTLVMTLLPIKSIIDTKTALNADILFDVGKSVLKPEAGGQLRFVAEFAKREKLQLELGGHTDPSGSDTDNLALSKARAEAVRTALIGLGIKEANITAEGYGETRLICTENNPECYKQNRRVEIKWKK